MSHQIVESFMKLRDRIRETQKTLSVLKAEEKLLIKEIQDYLNQREEGGLRIDENTILTLYINDKKINRNAKAYKEKLAQILSNRGIREEELVNDILSAKIENVVQQQRLKIVKTK